MEGGAFHNASLARASREDYVFVFLHQTRPDTLPSYKLVTEEFLPEEFLHPAYFFLRPDGTEADPANRHHHEALGPSQILGTLKSIQRDWGRGLTVRHYEEAKEELATAEAHLRAEEWDQAEKLLRDLSRLRAHCGIRDRAAAALAALDARRELLDDWRETEGVPETLRGEVETRLLAGDPAGAFLLLPDGGPSAAFRERLLAHLREAVRLRPIVLDKVVADGTTYFYLRAEFETDLPEVDGLVLQMSYLTDRDRTLEGFAVYDDVRPHRHHRVAMSLARRQLKYDEFANGRVQLWLGATLLHESLLTAEPATFPPDESHVKVGPDLLREDETLGAGIHGTLRSYRVGRYEP